MQKNTVHTYTVFAVIVNSVSSTLSQVTFGLCQVAWSYDHLKLKSI